MPFALELFLYALALCAVTLLVCLHHSHAHQRRLLDRALESPSLIEAAWVETWGFFDTRCLKVQLRGQGQRVVASEWFVGPAMGRLQRAGIPVCVSGAGG
jgi:hypothetical protein